MLAFHIMMNVICIAILSICRSSSLKDERYLPAAVKKFFLNLSRTLIGRRRRHGCMSTVQHLYIGVCRRYGHKMMNPVRGSLCNRIQIRGPVATHRRRGARNAVERAEQRVAAALMLNNMHMQKLLVLRSIHPIPQQY